MMRWLLVLALALAGCAPAAERRAAEPQPAAAPAGADALDFTGKLVDGGQLSGNDLRGGDVVLWYWAPW